MTGIAVVGLHRGGTSAVAGVLHHLGVFMGSDLLPPSEHNPKGYFEDRRFVELHTELMGGDWKNFRLGMRDRWEGGIRERYAELLAEFMEHEHWGIKDPRLCYCLLALEEAVPEDYDLRLIVVYRDMFYAAESLHARGGHTLEEARRITMDYMRNLLLTTNKTRLDTSMIHFPSFVECPLGAAATFAEICGLNPTPEQLQTADDFLEPNLVHWP